MHGIGGNGNDGQAGAGWLGGANRFGQAKAVQVGHMAVAQQQGVAARTGTRPLALSVLPHAQCNDAVLSHLAGVAQQAQLLLHHLAVGLVVFGQQDQLAAGHRLRDRGRKRALLIEAPPGDGCRTGWRQSPTGHGHGVKQVVGQQRAHKHFKVRTKGVAAARSGPHHLDSVRQTQIAGGRGEGQSHQNHGACQGVRRLLQPGARRCHIGHHGDAGTGALQVGRHDAHCLRVTCDDYHRHPGQIGIGWQIATRRTRQQRQLHRKFGALAQGTAHRHRAVHQLQQALGDRQAQPGAAKFARRALIGLHEGPKQPGHHDVAHADAVVGDAQAQARGAVGQRAGQHLQHHLGVAARPVARELDRIAQQVEQHLAQSGGVAQQPLRQVGRDKYRKLHCARVGECQNQLHRALGHLAQAGGNALDFQLAGLDFGEIQNVVQDVQQSHGRVLNGAQHALLFGQEGSGLQDVDHADDAIHGRADLVAHVGQEFGFGAVGRVGDDVGALQLGRFLLNQILQPVAVLLQLQLGGLARINVADGAAQKFRLALRVERKLAQGCNPYLAPIGGPDDLVLLVELATAGNHLVVMVQQRLPGLRNNQRAPVGNRFLKVFIDAKDVIQYRRALPDSGLDVGYVGTHVAYALGLGHGPQAALQGSGMLFAQTVACLLIGCHHVVHFRLFARGNVLLCAHQAQWFAVGAVAHHHAPTQHPDEEAIFAAHAELGHCRGRLALHMVLNGLHGQG